MAEANHANQLNHADGPGSTGSGLQRMVVEQGLATAAEVESCVKPLRDRSANAVGEAMVAQGLVTRKQLERLKTTPAVVDDPHDNGQQQQIPGYQIMGKLGQGAMATVFKAKQISLDRIVAVKVLPKKHTSNPQFVERFYYEGKAAAKLNHANIVGALDVGKAGDYHYFVMEYVDGHTVYDDIVKTKRYNEADALRIITQVAKALDHAHKAGFIHRDVKPKNIMITNDGVAKLADMGLARAVSDREAAEQEQGKAFGTPYYISPEQIRGEVDVDFRADLYGLGATLYHMLTGQVPFEGPNPSAVMHKHLKAPLVPPDHLVPELSAGICEIIEVCMAKRREERYAATSDLIVDLEAVARGEPPVHARRKFDLSSLDALEDKTKPGEPSVSVAPPPIPITAQPIFWAAIGGWAVALILLIVLIVTLLTKK